MLRRPRVGDVVSLPIQGIRVLRVVVWEGFKVHHPIRGSDVVELVGGRLQNIFTSWPLEDAVIVSGDGFDQTYENLLQTDRKETP